MLGKGVAIWDLSRKQLKNVNIVDTLRDLGMSWVSIKMTDGQYLFNRRKILLGYVDDLLPPLVESLKKAGIGVWGWGYVYGGYWSTPVGKKNTWPKGVTKKNGKMWFANGTNEAKVAVQRINQFDLDGWMIDVEGDMEAAADLKYNVTQSAINYMTTLKAGISPDVNIALNSFRHPLQHTGIPWKTYYSMCHMLMPQVYWVGSHNADQQLINSYNEINKHSVDLNSKKLPYIPMGSAYASEDGSWTPTIKDIQNFQAKAHELNLPGISYWALDEAGGPLERPDLYAAIKADKWNEVTPPVVEPPVIPEYTDAEKLQLLWQAHPELNKVH
jgi:hypothetical protein